MIWGIPAAILVVISLIILICNFRSWLWNIQNSLWHLMVVLGSHVEILRLENASCVLQLALSRIKGFVLKNLVPWLARCFCLRASLLSDTALFALSWGRALWHNIWIYRPFFLPLQGLVDVNYWRASPLVVLGLADLIKFSGTGAKRRSWGASWATTWFGAFLRCVMPFGYHSFGLHPVVLRGACVKVHLLLHRHVTDSWGIWESLRTLFQIRERVQRCESQFVSWNLLHVRGQWRASAIAQQILRILKLLKGLLRGWAHQGLKFVHALLV